MLPTIQSTSTIIPDKLGEHDCFVGSSRACKKFEACGKNFYPINLYARLNDIDKKRRIGRLKDFIRKHPGRTFHVSAIGCGRGHVDKKIIEHLVKPLVWLGNVRLPASFLIDLIKDKGYMDQLDNPRRKALKDWYREYCANWERRSHPDFYRAVRCYEPAIQKEILSIVADYNLKNWEFQHDEDFEDFMRKVRPALESVTKIPLPACLKGDTRSFDKIQLGGRVHLFKNGYNFTPLSKPEQPVVHYLRDDLKDWITGDERDSFFDNLDRLVKTANAWSHAGEAERSLYPGPAEDILSGFRSFVIQFRSFLDRV